jgi:hypothetical protein
MDPQGSGVGYAERDVGGTWTDHPQRIATDGEHVLDMVEFAGRLWACGSDGDPDHDYAVVWHSTDGGTTWVESLRDPVSVIGSRFFALAPFGDTLYVRNARQGHAFAWTAASGWQASAVELLPGANDGGPGATWSSGYLIPTAMPGTATTYDLYFFDGATSAPIARSIRGWSVGDDGALYALLDTRHIQRAASSADALSGAGLPLVPLGDYRCLCILPGCTQALVGQANSTVALVTLT